MSNFNERIDAMLAQQVMPPEYENFVSHILCNDCEMRSDAKYHFLYHKCAGCGSYNTKLLQTLQVDPDGTASSAPPAAGVGAAADMARELEQASNPLPVSPLLFNRSSASDRGAEGTEPLAGAGDAGSIIISNSRIRSGSVASSHRPSITSTDVVPVTTIIDYDEPDFE
ncbi:MAG: zinc-ribbon-domain-containing protein [Olpidium bornovanus]|uniref:Zinc-ribbon-domain-containing protein n=1 Tax=Olpidium bornovanus TaxID=278681 RepID=A0A8H7ZYY7_9FUNG|nr:MAG: zinc-ribbon-domain-containing protein [Olpidium bornovanus]